MEQQVGYYIKIKNGACSNFKVKIDIDDDSTGWVKKYNIITYVYEYDDDVEKSSVYKCV